MNSIPAIPDTPRPSADYPDRPTMQYQDSGRPVYSWVVVTEPSGPLRACFKCDYPEHEGVSCSMARKVSRVLEAMQIIRRRV